MINGPTINENSYYEFTYKTEYNTNYNIKIYTDIEVANVGDIMDTILTLDPFVTKLENKVSLKRVVPRVVSFSI